MKELMKLLFITIFLTFCTQYPVKQPNAVTNNELSDNRLVDNPNILEQQSSTIELEEIHDSDPIQSNNPSNDENSQLKEEPSQSVVIENKDKATTAVEDTPQKPSPGSSPSTTPENTSPKDQILKPEEPPATQPLLACPNALYDVNQPCDWIPPNLRPVDEQGSSVPLFTTSQEAWNWGDAQMMDQSSKWYMCGYNRMDGHTNDGTPFYYAYMKSCPTE